MAGLGGDWQVWQCLALRIGSKLTERGSSAPPHASLLIPAPALGSSSRGAAATSMPTSMAGKGSVCGTECSRLPSPIRHTRVLRVLSVPLVSGSPVGKEVEAGEGMRQLRLLLMRLQDGPMLLPHQSPPCVPHPSPLPVPVVRPC